MLGNGTASETHGPLLPGGFGNSVAAPTAPWTITLSKSGTLTVTDVQTSGDQFTLFDNGVAMAGAASPFTAAGQSPGQNTIGGGATSTPVPFGSTGVTDINLALGNADYSLATFALGPGVNVITGTFDGTITFGDFDFIAEVAGVPEPATWAMMLGGIGAVGAGMRMRRKTAGVLA